METVSQGHVRMQVRYFYESDDSNSILIDDHRKIGVSISDPIREIGISIDYKHAVDLNYIDIDNFESARLFIMRYIDKVRSNKVIAHMGSEIILCKLPYLYLDLEKENGFRFPIIQFGNHTMSGTGRLLVAQRHFPNIKIDVLEQHKSTEMGLSLTQLVEAVAGNWYWKDKSHEGLIMRISLKDRENYISDIEIDHQRDIASRGYETSPLIKKYQLADEIWQKQRQLILDWSIETKDDYLKLFDALIFENLELARKN